MRARWVVFASVIAPAAVGLALVCRGMLAGEAPVMRDYLGFEIPIKVAIAQAFAAGHIPQWWPWDGFGVPFAASPNTTVFHPSSLLLLLPFRVGFVLQLLWNAVVGGWGCYSVARALGTRAAFAGVSVAAWVLNGWALSLMEETAFGLAASGLPWLWWGVLRVHPRRPAACVALVLSIANMVLSGDLIMLSFAALSACALSTTPKTLAACIGAAVGAALISAVQWVPTLGLWAQSARSSSQGIHSSSFWNLSFSNWHQLVIPVPHIQSATSVYFSSVYVGASVLVLAAIGLGRAPRRWAWAAVAFVSLAVATGGDFPVWDALARFVPGWRALQYPAKAIGPFIAVACVLAGRGAQQLVRRGRSFVGALAAAAACGAWFFAPTAGLALGCAVAAAWLFPRRAAVAGWAIAAVLSADLTWQHRALIPTAPWESLSGGPIADALRAGGVGRDGYSFGQLTLSTEGRWSADVAEKFRRAASPLSNALEGLPINEGYLPSFSKRFWELVLDDQDAWRTRLAGVFATRFFVLSPSALKPKQLERIRGRDDELGVVAYELRNVLPKSYFTTGVTLKREAEVVAYLRSPQFMPGREVVLASDGPFAAPTSLAHMPSAPASAASAVHIDGDDVEVEVDSPEPGVVVLNESVVPGVTVTVDGVPAPLFAANHMARGVSVLAGHHLVRFHYETPGLREGAAVSLVGVMALVAWCLRRRRHGVSLRSASS